MYINFTIKSKNKNSLTKFNKAFRRVLINKKLSILKKTVFFQKKGTKKVFTILKSPHVNKTAQEQFQFNLFVKNLRIKSFKIVRILVILKKIQSVCFADVQIKIKFILDSELDAILNLDILDPFIRRFIPGLKFTKKRFKCYLLRLNAFGKQSFQYDMISE